MAIRYTQEDNRQLRNAQRRFAAAVKRNADKVDAQYLADVPSLREIKASIKTRADYNTWMGYLNSFAAPNALKISRTYNVPIAYVNQTKRLNTLANRRDRERTERIVSLLEDSGQSADIVKQMGTAELQNYSPRKVTPGRTPEELVRFNASRKRRANKDYTAQVENIYKTNYIAALTNPRHIETSDADRILKLIANVPASQFFDLSIQKKYRTLYYIYDPSEEFDVKGENIYNSWQSVIQSQNQQTN